MKERSDIWSGKQIRPKRKVYVQTSEETEIDRDLRQKCGEDFVEWGPRFYSSSPLCQFKTTKLPGYSITNSRSH